jgi:hypothetical protein
MEAPKVSADPPKGTMGHVKAMAAAVFLHTSQRGSVFPRLNITIDFRDPKHIRLRTYDARNRVVDTLGANDIAEAALLTGFVVRYAETMNARRLRSQAAATVATAATPTYDGSRVGVGLMMDGFELARGRFNNAVTARAADQAFFALFEALNWAVALDDFLAECWRPHGTRLGFDWRREIANAEIFGAVRYARNRVHHQWADALKETQVEHRVLPFGSTSLAWREFEELPTPTEGREDVTGREAYRTLLEGQTASFTLSDMGQVLATMRQFVDPPRPTLQ